MPQRNYRDPLHNIISLDESVPEDRLIIDLIDCAEFQRLRRVKQLGLAMLTYQGAEHSRFTHSLGVMHLMTRVLGLLSKQLDISPESKAAARAGSLLHDVGHGPFSHVVEKVFRFHHEDWSRRIILDDVTEVNGVLRRYDESLPAKTASLFDHTFKPEFISQLVSSQLDCDRMDYLLRDSLMTGAKYGVYDLEWVLHALRVDEINDRIYVEAKGLYAVEEYLQARYYMFRQVYFHRALRSAEAVLVSALSRARRLMEKGGLKFRMRNSPLEKMMVGGEVTTSEYLSLDDTDVTFYMKQWMAEPDPVLSDLCRRFVNRKLFKATDLTLSGEELDIFMTLARASLQQAGFDPDYYLIIDRAGDIPYYGYYSPAEADQGRLIYVEKPGGGIAEISEVSEVVRAMRGYKIERICYPVEMSSAIATALTKSSGASAGGRVDAGRA